MYVLSILIATHTFVYTICNNVCKGTFHVTVSTRTILALVGLGTGNFTFISQSVILLLTSHSDFTAWLL